MQNASATGVASSGVVLSHAPPFAPPPPPRPPAIDWCDPTHQTIGGDQLSGPCLHGLAWWIWLLLIAAGMLSVFLAIGCARLQLRRGNSPCQLLAHLEAILIANHATPSRTRLAGRALRHSRPIYDIFEAQDCFCYFKLYQGLFCLGLCDLVRLSVHAVYAVDAFVIYRQTAPHSGSEIAGLMDSTQRNAITEMALFTIISVGIKGLLWLLVFLSFFRGYTRPIRALLLWLPFELIHAIVWLVVHSTHDRHVCAADMRIFSRNGHVGFRRNYLYNLGPKPWEVDNTCEVFRSYELFYAICDTFFCAFLTVYSAYIGYSYLQQLERNGRRRESMEKRLGIERLSDVVNAPLTRAGLRRSSTCRSTEC